MSEEFARQHPDRAYAVSRGPSAPLVGAVAGGVVGLAALAAGAYYRSRR